MGLPNDVGPEQIMTADEYLQSRSNDVVLTAAPADPPVSTFSIFLIPAT